ncbi:MAG TPA: hypothetical protein VFE62_18460 [Gemmataceae bacterium]|nr:hypothetical protein [Gemmataceae bacterium]
MAAGAAACACVLIVLAVFPRSSVTKGNIDRITNRMSRAEVEEIFAEKGSVFFESEAGIEVAISWNAPDGSGASILFENDSVIQKEWTDSSQPILGRIRHWIRILKTATRS